MLPITTALPEISASTKDKKIQDQKPNFNKEAAIKNADIPSYCKNNGINRPAILQIEIEKDGSSGKTTESPDMQKLINIYKSGKKEESPSANISTPTINQSEIIENINEIKSCPDCTFLCEKRLNYCPICNHRFLKS